MRNSALIQVAHTLLWDILFEMKNSWLRWQLESGCFIVPTWRHVEELAALFRHVTLLLRNEYVAPFLISFYFALLGKDLTSQKQLAVWSARALGGLDPKSEKFLANFYLKTSPESNSW